MNFGQYVSPPWETSIIKGVPVTHKDEFLHQARLAGFKVKIRYRGPRKHRLNRSPVTQRSSCILADAVTFTVYNRK